MYTCNWFTLLQSRNEHNIINWLHSIKITLKVRDFPSGSAGKESICNAWDTGDAGLIPGSGRSPGVCVLSLQLCLTLCKPVDCSSPASSVHGILQARILEWVAMPSSRGSSQPRDWTCVSYVSCIGFTTSDALEALPWNRKWQPTLVFLPGKLQGQRTLGRYRGPAESDRTDD